MHETFEVDGLIYELAISASNEVAFAIIGGGNPAYQPEMYDPFDYWDYMPQITEEIGVTRYPIRVYRAMLTHLHQWVGSQRPSMFRFTASSKRYHRIYMRVAYQLADRFDYDLQIMGDEFHFFKRKRNK